MTEPPVTAIGAVAATASAEAAAVGAAVVETAAETAVSVQTHGTPVQANLQTCDVNMLPAKTSLYDCTCGVQHVCDVPAS